MREVINMEMLFNNYLISQLINIVSVKRDAIAEQNIESLAINGRNGEIFQGRTLGTKSIKVDFYMKYEFLPRFLDGKISSSEFQEVVRALAFYLTNNDSPAKLIFSDDPDKYHLAMCTGFDVDRVLRLGEGSISFICHTPYLFELYPTTFTQNNNGIVTIDNNATASAYPILSTTLSRDTMSISYVSSNGVIQIGKAPKSGETPDIKLHHENCVTAAKWYNGTANLLTGSGRVIDDSTTFISDGWALHLNKQPSGEAGSGNYVGAFMMTNLDKVSTNKYWDADVYFTCLSQPTYTSTGNSPEQRGMIEFNFYDINNVPLINFSMRDYEKKYEHNVPFLYNGRGTHLWSDGGTLGTIKTQTYSQQFNSLDDVPTNATILANWEMPKYKIKFKYNGTPLYSSHSTSSKLISKLGAGSEFTYKTETVGWYCIYLNDEKTNVAWVQANVCEKIEDGTIITVTYSLPVDSASQSVWNHFTGCLNIGRYPHPNGTGSIWRAYIHKRIGTDSSGTNSPIVHSTYKTFYDPNDEFTTGGAFGRFGVYMASYEDSPMLGRMTFDGIVVRSVDANSTEDEAKLIGVAGDTISVDCNQNKVFKNGVPFMDMVDVGSQFFSIAPYTSQQVRIITDDAGAKTSAEIVKRWL